MSRRTNIPCKKTGLQKTIQCFLRVMPSAVRIAVVVLLRRLLHGQDHVALGRDHAHPALHEVVCMHNEADDEDEREAHTYYTHVRRMRTRVVYIYACETTRTRVDCTHTHA